MGWFEKRGRHDLPWRRNWDPYRILVSELMLQQTTVAAVIPYFRRFLKTFPTIKRLAGAPLERVLEHWSGLGYYARARNLHKTAKKIAKEHGGRMPGDRKQVEDLPGVGPYTTGAILSLAFDKPAALVDGNVIRVLARIYGIQRNTKHPRVLAKIWTLARSLVPPGGARAFNSALMDLGALVCRPRSPDCPACPFSNICLARRWGRQEEIPITGPETARKVVHVHTALIERNGRWLLRRRPAEGLYGGLWEFPGVESGRKSSSAEAALLLKKRFRASPLHPRPLPSITHTLSHREMRVHPWRCRLSPGAFEGEWFAGRDIGRLAISSLTRRIWDRTGENQ